MAMSKKDFIALADVFKTAHERILKDETTPQIRQGRFDEWQRLKIDVAVVCGNSNPAFKVSRWFDYIEGKCGPNGGNR